MHALARHPALRGALVARGYTEDEHAHGWHLLLTAAGYYAPSPPALVADDNDVARAMAELDAWGAPHFRIMRAALTHRFPRQAAFVLGGLRASSGYGAVVNVAALLARLDMLESGASRTKTRADDRAALELLAKRGIDASERKRLRDLIIRAEAPPSPTVAAPIASAEKGDDALLALHRWHREWADVARADIKRRDHLVVLGLAKRKARGAQKTLE